MDLDEHLRNLDNEYNILKAKTLQQAVEPSKEVLPSQNIEDFWNEISEYVKTEESRKFTGLIIKPILWEKFETYPKEWDVQFNHWMHHGVGLEQRDIYGTSCNYLHKGKSLGNYEEIELGRWRSFAEGFASLDYLKNAEIGFPSRDYFFSTLRVLHDLKQAQKTKSLKPWQTGLVGSYFDDYNAEKHPGLFEILVKYKNILPKH